MKKQSAIGLQVLCIVFLICWSIACQAGDSQEAASTVSSLVQDGEFNAFWRQFRDAALRDPGQLAGLTNFPLVIKGNLDGEPLKKCDAEGLQRSWRAILSGSVFVLGSHGDFVKTTLREFLQWHDVLTPEMIKLSGERRLRVNDFQFVRVDRRWRLEMIYADLEDVSCPMVR